MQPVPAIGSFEGCTGRYPVIEPIEANEPASAFFAMLLTIDFSTSIARARRLPD